MAELAEKPKAEVLTREDFQRKLVTGEISFKFNPTNAELDRFNQFAKQNFSVSQEKNRFVLTSPDRKESVQLFFDSEGGKYFITDIHSPRLELAGREQLEAKPEQLTRAREIALAVDEYLRFQQSGQPFTASQAASEKLARLVGGRTTDFDGILSRVARENAEAGAKLKEFLEARRTELAAAEAARPKPGLFVRRPEAAVAPPRLEIEERVPRTDVKVFTKGYQIDQVPYSAKGVQEALATDPSLGFINSDNQLNIYAGKKPALLDFLSSYRLE